MRTLLHYAQSLAGALFDTSAVFGTHPAASGNILHPIDYLIIDMQPSPFTVYSACVRPLSAVCCQSSKLINALKLSRHLRMRQRNNDVVMELRMF